MFHLPIANEPYLFIVCMLFLFTVNLPMGKFNEPPPQSPGKKHEVKQRLHLWHLRLLKNFMAILFSLLSFPSFSFICLNKSKVNISTLSQVIGTCQPNSRLYSGSPTHWLPSRMGFYTNKSVPFVTRISLSSAFNF